MGSITGLCGQTAMSYLCMIFYLDLDEEMITKVLSVNEMLNLNQTQSCLDRAYVSWSAGSVIHSRHWCIISPQIFLQGMDAYVYSKQRKSMQDGQTVFFNINKEFLNPDNVVRQATDGEKKGLNWGKYDTLHKEQHMIMKSIADHGYHGVGD